MKFGGTCLSYNLTRLKLLDLQLWFRSTDATVNNEDGISNSCNKIILDDCPGFLFLIWLKDDDQEEEEEEKINRGRQGGESW